MENQPQTTNMPLAAKRKNALREAYESVPRTEKTRGISLIVYAAITVAVLICSRLIWLFKPLLDKIYYGTLSEAIYYTVLFLLCVVNSVLLDRHAKKNCGERIFMPRKTRMTIPRALAIIAVCAAAVFIAGAALRFKSKIQLEMGSGVTLATALINAGVYVYYGCHMWLGLTAAVFVQRGLSILFPTKYTVPWGAIFLVTVYGLIELALEIWTTSHMYPWMYYLFSYVYAAVFVLADHRFHVTYWAMFIVMVL